MSNKKYNRSKKSKSDINVPNNLSTVKMKVIFIVILLLIIALIFRIAYLKFIDGDKLQSLATSQQTLTETLTAKRGNIYDANGEALALSYDTDKIYLNPSEIDDENKETFAKEIADILEIDSTELISKINSSTNRFLVASDVVQEKVTALTDWKSTKEKKKLKTGISFEDSTSRYYPRNTLASTVIGFVGSDNQGLAGIESSCDSLLRGTSGKSVSLKDASQSQIVNSEETYIAAENGYDINLTIDVNIQSIVERHLAEAVDEYKCKSGITIAMDPSTGKILAMADYPNYDCNNYNSLNSSLEKIWESLSDKEKSDAKYNMWKPKAVTNLYEPGSVFKIITSSIALEENITDTDIPNTFNCTGSMYFEGESKPVNCWKKDGSHGYQDLRHALMNSCNPSFMQLGLKIGKDLTYKYYDAFGFFNKTDISLSGEPDSGIFYSQDKIKPIELAIMSFGQRFTITPLQMITAASAIANDGVLVKPQIIDKITNTDTGEVTTFSTEVVRQVVSKETADKVASMMESVVTKGTGGRAKVSGYSIGGKTGTSEPISDSKAGYVASFLGISPVENTKIVLLVILDSPEGSLHNGGQIAAPTAQKMFEEILPYMGIESGNKDSENLNTSVDNLY